MASRPPAAPATARPAAPTGGLGRAWGAALALFVLAGLTGALFRFASAFGWAPDDLGGLLLGNVRHAHSHLMFFGWATPALMALIVRVVENRTGRAVRGAGPVLATVLGLALLAYPPFLLWGYAPAELGGARLPLSVIGAGLNVLGWYAFAALYVRATRALPRDTALRVLDLAVGFLVLSTLGAWGLPLTTAAGIGDEALKVALTHLFLDTFSEGWFVLGVLGLAAGGAERALPVWPVRLAAAGVPFAFALALPAGVVPDLWKALAGLGSVCVGVGLLATVAVLWPALRPGPARAVWRLALLCLGLKAAGQVVVAFVPGVNWADLYGLRILYLHLMLLGFVTLGLMAAGTIPFGGRGARAMAVAVILLLTSLLPLSGFWPAALRGPWALVAAGAALLPVAAALYALLTLRHPPR